MIEKTSPAAQNRHLLQIFSNREIGWVSRHRDCLFDLLIMPIILYTLALWLILPLLVLKLVLRIIKNPSYLNRLGERFGNGKKI